MCVWYVECAARLLGLGQRASIMSNNCPEKRRETHHKTTRGGEPRFPGLCAELTTHPSFSMGWKSSGHHVQHPCPRPCLDRGGGRDGQEKGGRKGREGRSLSIRNTTSKWQCCAHFFKDDLARVRGKRKSYPEYCLGNKMALEEDKNPQRSLVHG